jgi:hypothetical protein
MYIMLDAEFSIGSYKIKVKMLLAFLFLIWIIFAHTICSCCLIEGLAVRSSNSSSSVLECKSSLSKYVNKIRKKNALNNEKILFDSLNKSKNRAVNTVQNAVDSLNTEGISVNVKNTINNLKTAVDAFKIAKNSDTQKAIDVTNFTKSVNEEISTITQNTNSKKNFVKKAKNAVNASKDAVKAYNNALKAKTIADTCRKPATTTTTTTTTTSSKEGFTNSSYADKNASTFILDPSIWKNSYSSTITNKSSPSSLSSNSSGPLSIFSDMKFAPECCPNAYTSSNGCACMDQNMYKYLQNRGGNNVPFSQF